MTKSGNSVKQDKLIQTAKSLFFKYGIKRVSVAEICQEARVSKMTFYKYYANKEDLAKAFLLEANAKGMREYETLMAKEIPFSEKIKQLIENKLRDTEGVSQEFIKDILNEKGELYRLMMEKREESLAVLLNDFKKAEERGEIRKGIKPEFISYFLEKTMSMVSDEKLLPFYKNEQELIMEVTNFFFYGLGIKDE